jgi:hypothetical protein
MANRNFDFLQVLGKGVKVVSGSFAPNGSNPVDAASVKGKGFSVARSSAGVFTVTLQDAYVALLSAHCSIQLASPDDKFVQFGAIDVVNAKTAQIVVWDVSGAGVSDVAANSGNRIHFTLVLANSTVV